MLKTPSGTINVYVDGVPVDFEASEYLFKRHPCKDKPLAGCYRIEMDARGHSTISCVVELSDPSLRNTGDSGQDYLNTEFISGSTILTIGMEDDNPAFESIRTRYGLQCNILQPIGKVVIGIAWATDYEGTEDVRTWYAADPTLD